MPSKPERPKPPVEDLRQAVARYQEATAATEAARQELSRQRQIKKKIIHELYSAGMTYSEIARALGISQQRVHNLSVSD